MRNVEKKTEVTKKEFNLEQAFVLWKTTSKDGKTTYYTGKLVCNDQNASLICFANGMKKNPKEPDYRVYLKPGKDEYVDKEIASLWVKLSKNDKKYLTGKSDDGEYLTGFINEDPSGKKPTFSVYFAEKKESK